MKLAAQLIHLLIHMNASTCLIHLYPVSVVRLCLIYKLEKLTDKQFQMKLLPSYPSGNLELKLHMLLEFQMAFTPPPPPGPPCPQNSSPRNPSPSEFQDAACVIGMVIFWNYPMGYYTVK